MSMSLVPVGAVVERRYYALPTNYSIGDEFADRDEAVVEARKRYEADVAKHLARGWDPESAHDLARAANHVALRWFLRYPEGGGMDVEIERWRDITKLRTSVEVG